MIPKIIHYCWYGEDFNQSMNIRACILSWKKYMPDWEIMKWDESNSDLEKSVFAKKMLNEKKYAFVSDYVRLSALSQFGGVYFDTDVEVYKNFDKLLDKKVFLGFMWDCVVSTAIIGAEANNQLINDLKLLYEDGTINKPIVNNEIFTDFLLNKYTHMRLNNLFQELEEGVCIYPKEYFEFPSTKKKIEPYSRHLYNQSWREASKKPLYKKVIRKILGDPLYFKLNHDLRLVKGSKYYERYLRDKEQ